MKNQAKPGDRVILHFTGRTQDEDVFATTKGEQPVEITIGEGKVIPGVENGILGMQIGESRTFNVPPEQAFGVKQEELVTTVKKNDLPEAIQPSIGQKLQIKDRNDIYTDVWVTRIEAEDVTIDANHPLAGQTLTFEIDLLDIQ